MYTSQYLHVSLVAYVHPHSCCTSIKYYFTVKQQIISTEYSLQKKNCAIFVSRYSMLLIFVIFQALRFYEK